eukprot:15329718-Ditylum_brightwellii.AAC.1
MEKEKKQKERQSKTRTQRKQPTIQKYFKTGNKMGTTQVETDSDKETGAEHNRHNEIDQIREQAEERKNDTHDYYKLEGKIGQERFLQCRHGNNLDLVVTGERDTYNGAKEIIRQPGGTFTLTTGKWASHIILTGRDNLEQWSRVTLQGKKK